MYETLEPMRSSTRLRMKRRVSEPWCEMTRTGNVLPRCHRMNSTASWTRFEKGLSLGLKSMACWDEMIDGRVVSGMCSDLEKEVV